MSVDTSPVRGFSHIQLTVSDVAESERWYTVALGLERLTAAEDGSYVALRHRLGKVVVVLSLDSQPHRADTVGGRLDHLAFLVPDTSELEGWAAQLSDLGFDHSGVVDEDGRPSLMLTDPDGIQIELVAPRNH
jgi:catechol-2,3-dioxygenase